MALAAPDQYKETGLLANIVGGGSNVIQNAISAAIDRGKQASNLMAGQEANFQTQLNNSINRAQRKNEFDASRADRQDEFVATFGQNEDKLDEGKRQFDVRMLFDEKKETHDYNIASQLLEEKKKETASLVASRTADTARGLEASKRADKAMAISERDTYQQFLAKQNEAAYALGAAFDRDQDREERQRARDYRDQLIQKSNSMFVTPEPGAPAGPLKVNPNASDEDMRSYVHEAIKSNDPQVIGRASVLQDHLMQKGGTMSDPQALATKFDLLDAAEAGVRKATARIKDLQGPQEVGKNGKPKRSPADIAKEAAAQMDLIKKFDSQMKNEDPELIRKWRLRKKNQPVGDVTVPAGAAGAAGTGNQKGVDLTRQTYFRKDPNQQ